MKKEQTLTLSELRLATLYRMRPYMCTGDHADTCIDPTLEDHVIRCGLQSIQPWSDACIVASMQVSKHHKGDIVQVLINNIWKDAVVKDTNIVFKEESEEDYVSNDRVYSYVLTLTNDEVFFLADEDEMCIRGKQSRTRDKSKLKVSPIVFSKYSNAVTKRIKHAIRTRFVDSSKNTQLKVARVLNRFICFFASIRIQHHWCFFVSRLKRMKVSTLLSRIKELETQLKNVEQLRECSICIDSKARMCLNPCGHVCICASCFWKRPIHICPICRAEVYSAVKIFV